MFRPEGEGGLLARFKRCRQYHESSRLCSTHYNLAQSYFAVLLYSVAKILKSSIQRDHFDFSHLKPAAMSHMPRICVLRVEKGPSQEIEIDDFLEQIVFYIYRIYIRKVTGLSENMTGR